MTPVHGPRRLGASGISVPPLGVGTNRWGSPGRQGPGRNSDEIYQALQAAMNAGINLIDTAEIYTGGNSERLVGELTRRDGRPAIICSKFAPLPTRLSAKQLLVALDASLQRLQVQAIDLYYVHFPFTLLSIGSMMQAMTQAHRAGKIRAIGVSNFNARQMREAATCLARHGIALAANEVHYSLLHRRPEANGVLQACRELNVALVAYYPLGSGRLTAPSPADAPPRAKSWVRRLMQPRMASPAMARQLSALRETIAAVARTHGATASQVALNWLLQRDDLVIAIPGATSAAHVRDNAAALQWSLSADEFAAIDRASSGQIRAI